MKEPIEIKKRAVFRYKFGYRRNGIDFFPNDFRDNLILDSGLDKVASVAWQSCWFTMLLGNQVSPTPIQRGSGSVTVSQTANTLTASGSFFQSSDVGRLFKFDSGNEIYITAFTSSTVVTCGGPSNTVASSPGTIWYVNETALDHFYVATTGILSGGSNNGTSAIGNVVTYKRTFLGSAITGSSVTLTEIGFSDSTTNANLFDRDIIPGGITLLVGDQPLAVAQLIMTITPDTSVSVGNVGTGIDTSGNAILSGLNFNDPLGAISYVDTSGVTSSIGNNFLEPSQAGAYAFGAITATFTLPGFSNGVGPSYTATSAVSPSLQAYSSGNFYRDFNFSFGTSLIVGNIYGYLLGPVNQAGWVQKFTTPFAKLNTQTLTGTIRRSWQRILTN